MQEFRLIPGNSLRVSSGALNQIHYCQGTPCSHSRNFSKVQHWKGLGKMQDISSIVDDQPEEILQAAAAEAGFVGQICEGTASNVKYAILFHEVILKRKVQLNILKREFTESGIREFLQTRPYLTAPLFPATDSLEVTKDMFLSKIRGYGNYQRILGIITKFVTDSMDADIVKKMLSCWTGWEFLPDSKLELRVEDGVTFAVHACSMEMVVPENISEYSLTEYLKNLCFAGTSGFGKS